MSAEEIDRHVSQIVFGTVNDDFHPSQNEQDAWQVLGWLQQKRIRIIPDMLTPSKICDEVLKLAS